MRTALALAISLFGVSCLAQESTLATLLADYSWTAKPYKILYSVDLAKPGALDRLERDNPEHYAKVVAVRHAASRPSCVDDLKVLKVQLDLDDASCAAMTTLTSLPAKKTVSVVIEGVHYMTFAPIGFEPAKSVPLRHSPGITPLR